jgi:NAD(P)-dependent dehydrogenase (short-subunit alcohol dehydrogenase family)
VSSRFRGRRAIVTGAASGIGAAIGQALAAEGAIVIGMDLEQSKGKGGKGIEIRMADVSDEEAVADLVGGVAEGGSIDALFNVAGVGATTTAPDTALETWERVLSVNATGTFLMCKYAIPVMVAHGGGAIVNIASIAGLVGLPRRAAYCASKGAVIGLTRALAVDHVAEGVRVNCVAPGTVDSPWVRRLVEESGESLDALEARQPMGRLGTTAEIAAAALYLASDDAKFATGSVLTIDGGMTAA